jgi:hypothetical protein
MTAEEAQTDEKEPFSLTIGSSDHSDAFGDLSTQLVKLLRKQPTKLPVGISVTLSGNALDESAMSKKRQSISAAAAVLASAAVTGRQPGNVTILGVLDASGAFKLSPGFWDQLKALKGGKGERLVLPTAAAEYLPAMLVLNQPEFFMKHEVLLASNFTELLDLTAEIPNETLAKVSAHFQECCKNSANRPLMPYLSDPIIRRRLEEIARLLPYHQSAKMLSIQVAAIRPQLLSRAVLAAELRSTTVPLRRLVNGLGDAPYAQTVGKLIGKTHDTCRDQVSVLSRMAGKQDQELIMAVKNTLPTVSNLERATKIYDSDDDVQYQVSLAQSRFERSYSDLLEKLTQAAGDELDPLPRED